MGTAKVEECPGAADETATQDPVPRVVPATAGEGDGEKDARGGDSLPWTVNDVDKHKKGLTPAQKKQWVKIANGIYDSCMAQGGADEECATKAIRIANSKVGSEKAMEAFRFLSPLQEPQENVGIAEIAITGKWEHPRYGELEITEETIDSFIRNFESGVRAVQGPEGSNQLVVDYQHASLEPDPERAKAAGWIKRLWKEKRGGRTVLKAEIEWTPRAAEYIRNKEYLYISPEFSLNYIDKQGKKVGPTLLAAALTNRPFLEELKPVLLMMEGVLIVEASETAPEPIFEPKEGQNTDGGEKMDEKAKFEALPSDQKIALWYELEFGEAEGLEEGKALLEEVQVAQLKEWTRQWINRLPNGSFAVIEPAYLKGETEDKRCRHLPHHGPGGGGTRNVNLDLPHLRNALARANQIKPVTTSISVEELREKAMNHLEKHKSVLKTYKTTEEVNQMDEKEVQKLTEERDQLKVQLAEAQEHIKGLETELEETRNKLAEVSQKLREAEVDKAWKEALEQGKVLPAEEETMKALAMKDFDLFKKMVESRPKLVEFDEKGGADNSDLKEKAEMMLKELQEKGMSYVDALAELEKNHPELFKAL